jgi:4,5-DOPA dioxygenase extradiol
MKSRHLNRRTVLTGLGLAAAGGVAGLKMMGPSKNASPGGPGAQQKIEELLKTPDRERMPALFVGHGSPMNAVTVNEWTQAWRDIGTSIPTPKAILSISAHWLTRNGLLVTANDKPQMTYDMGGFPPELYQQQYPAPGNPGLAGEIESIISGEIAVQGDSLWGFDHGTWVVLKHMFPDANVPVIQLSLDYGKAPAFHYELAKLLQPLRTKGVLIIGSGNIVHNLREMIRTSDTPFDWALDFDSRMNAYINEGNHQAIVDFRKLGPLAEIAHPTHDHFLPLLYALGLQTSGEEARSFCDGFQYRSVSMRSFRVG